MKIFTIIIIIITPIFVFGQIKETNAGIGLMELSQVNQGNSYVTFPTDIGLIRTRPDKKVVQIYDVSEIINQQISLRKINP